MKKKAVVVVVKKKNNVGKIKYKNKKLILVVEMWNCKLKMGKKGNKLVRKNLENG